MDEGLGGGRGRQLNPGGRRRDMRRCVEQNELAGWQAAAALAVCVCVRASSLYKTEAACLWTDETNHVKRPHHLQHLTSSSTTLSTPKRYKNHITKIVFFSAAKAKGDRRRRPFRRRLQTPCIPIQNFFTSKLKILLKGFWWRGLFQQGIHFCTKWSPHLLYAQPDFYLLLSGQVSQISEINCCKGWGNGF